MSNLQQKISLVLLVFFVTTLFRLSADNPTKVACVGNSVTFGLGIQNPEGNYPSQLQQLLGEEFSVKNFGNSGATLLRNGHKPYFSLPEFKEALAFTPDVVIIHLGLNDTDPRNWPYYRDQFVSDYSAMIDSFRTVNPRAEIKICRLTPIFPQHPRFKSSTRDWYWQIQETIETVAEINEVELVDLTTPLHRRPDLFPDALHPTKEGASIIAQTIYGAITQDYGGLQLPNLFSNNMVLQRNQPIRFWGTANGGTTVSITFNQQHQTVTANQFGHWEVSFPPMQAGGPYTATIANEATKVELTNLLIGDLWVCSGQSNMEFKLSASTTAQEDIASAHNSQIRFFNMQPIAYTDNSNWDTEILNQINALEYFQPANWEISTPESVKDISAIAYHFGKSIHEHIDIPIGLIVNAVGGSPTESWIDRYTLEHDTRLVDMFLNWDRNDYIHPWVRSRASTNTKLAENKMQRHPYHPAYLYESTISQLTQLPITGVIWYQGESNEHNVELHQHLFPQLVHSWRQAWQTELPFYFVQLSSMAVGRETWGHFRDSQRKLAQTIPHVAMAVSSDHGDSTDVHPRNKKPVGERLALQALYNTYGVKHITPSGPTLSHIEQQNSQLILHFENANGLTTSDGQPPLSFEIAEYPGCFHPAQAVIVGSSVQLQSTQVKNPRLVRYGWSSYSNGNLVNAEQLPASTFSETIN